MASQDFFGFWFNGVHSSELGFKRVSNGSRYQENILPAFQDKTVPVSGGDGAYYFDTNYNNKTFQIQIATDRMTELQYRKLRQIFDAKNTGPLIFDESPYKVYTAKVQSPPQFNFICFDELVTVNGVQTNQRIYKGEGTIQFICYYPYAKSYYKYLDQYVDGQEKPAGVPYWNNKGEWAEASGMLASQIVDSTVYDGYNSNEINLYNAGDIEADSIIWFRLRGDRGLYSGKVDDGKRTRVVEVPYSSGGKIYCPPTGTVLYILENQTELDADKALAAASAGSWVTFYTHHCRMIITSGDCIVDDDGYIMNGKEYSYGYYAIKYDDGKYYLSGPNPTVYTIPEIEFSENLDNTHKIVDGGNVTINTDTTLTLAPKNDYYNYYLSFSAPENVTGSIYLSINSKTNLISYCDINRDPIRSANELIKAGDFFKIPQGESVISTETSTKKIESVQYDYLYY